MTILDALIDEYEILSLLRLFEKYTEISQNKELLKITSDKNKLNNFISNRQIIDVVIEYPTKLSSNQLKIWKANSASLLIASSQSEVDEEVQLTVGVVEYEQLGFLHTGAASGSCKELQQMIEQGLYSIK